MTSHRSTRNLVQTAALGAISAVLLSGCAGGAKLSRIDQGAPRAEAKARQNNDRTVVRAERQVERNPNSASLRTELGIAYLNVGRFESASTALSDAMRLGDNNARTALSLALAKIGTGHGREAVALLDDWRDSIPVSDLGLALALAGETGRGVAVLADALRGGENTPKLRQNLAYAYALDGRWREARTMAEQDVPADKIDARISEWAMSAKPGDFKIRVAALLGAPVRSDPGLPQELALISAPATEQLAAEATAVQTQSYATPVSATTELPATEEPVAPAVAVEEPVLPVPAPQPVEPRTVAAAPAPVAPSSFSNAFAAPVFTAPVDKPERPKRTVRVAMPEAKAVVRRNGTHQVQLGSFSSAEGARRAWGIYTSRNPSLRNYRMVITPAVVNGKNYWRVAAGGFEARAASGWCSSLRNRGGACFAYASSRPPVGAVPGSTPRATGPQMARRR
ncbi:MAG: SPOR domain-containing protein [Novosphingobium sp.]